MPNPKLPAGFVASLKRIKNKRARIVALHILKHGSITTEELQRTYGYDHPPRAARDLRELGVPLETFRAKSREGKTIAAYRFGDPREVRAAKLQGRKSISKDTKQKLLLKFQGRCSICLEAYDPRHLQVDHRVPYEIAGDTGSEHLEDYMLLCGSCNRAKSWSCEHCANWHNDRLSEVCLTCYWASPAKYNHIALCEVRRLDVSWTGEEIATYNRLVELASAKQSPLPAYVKQVLARHATNSHGEDKTRKGTKNAKNSLI